MDCNKGSKKSKDNIVDNKKCLFCQKKEITYSCIPCGCEILCDKCAEKLKHGGKCKKCEDSFKECRRIGDCHYLII
jgi:hypothetical protein